jgi:hypothetical protein
MSPALILILAGAVIGAPPAPASSAPAEAAPSSTYGPAVPTPTRTAVNANAECPTQNERDVVVCAERRQTYRLDPSVMDAKRQAESGGASDGVAMPPAQVSCSAAPMGCGKGLAGLDLANAAMVLGTAAVRAAKGEDWAKAFRGPDEYQLYLQAKWQREKREKEERARAIAAEARQK